MINSYTTGDLKAAVNTHNEIMINCKEYLAPVVTDKLAITFPVDIGGLMLLICVILACAPSSITGVEATFVQAISNNIDRRYTTNSTNRFFILL
jgi:hypothetical protein